MIPTVESTSQTWRNHITFFLVNDEETEEVELDAAALAEFQAEALEIRMFYVGSGQVVLITRNDGDTAILIDGGAANGKTNKKRARPLGRLLRPKSLRAIVASHPHADHTNFHVTLATEFPDVFSDDAKYFDNATTPADEDFAALQAEGDLPFVRHAVVDDVNMDTNERIDDFGGDGEVHVHMIRLDRPETDQDLQSIFMWLFYRDTRFLFTGDVDEDYELEILSRVKAIDNRTHLLNLTHHGNKDGNTQELIDALRPAIAVASTHDDKGHELDDEVRGRLGDTVIRATKDTVRNTSGDVVIRTDGFIWEAASLDGVLFEVEDGPSPALGRVD